MSMQFASARLVNGGDGIGVSNSAADGDPAGSGCWIGQGSMGRSWWVAVVCGTWCRSGREKIGYSVCGWMVLVLVTLGGWAGRGRIADRTAVVLSSLRPSIQWRCVCRWSISV